MKKAAILTATLATLASAMIPSPILAQDERRYEEEEKKKDNTGAIVAGIAALGIGIAIATSKHGDDHRHDNQWDGNLYGDPFSPSNGVTCVPRQRTCYDRGDYSYSWTKRIFGTSAGWGGSGGSGGSWGGSGGSGGSWGGSGGSGNSGDLDRARRVCVDRGRDRGMKNINVESVQPHNSKTARVYMQSRRSSATVSTDRWRCDYSYGSGRTEFKRI